mmetsp:Transcript_10195/g.11451  ORF Transcript_10195/g.11451 Transcript_10195/m.11451 type:complete len:87 (+) Transcript_10195:26-286(+)
MFVFFHMFEQKWNMLHPYYGFRFLMFNKCLDYKMSHPSMSMPKRFFWMFFRIFLCGTLYDFYLGELSAAPIIRSFDSYLLITWAIH